MKLSNIHLDYYVINSSEIFFNFISKDGKLCLNEIKRKDSLAINESFSAVFEMNSKKLLLDI